MRVLSDKQDPTGFLNLFRLASMDRFGDPSGHIQGRGRWEHGRKKGPGRRAKAGTHSGSMRSNAVTRNPDTVRSETIGSLMRNRTKVLGRLAPFGSRFPEGPLRQDAKVLIVERGPVRMKLPRLRRCSR